MTGINDEMFKDYCEKTNKNYKSKSVEKQFIKDVYNKKIVLNGDKLEYGL